MKTFVPALLLFCLCQFHLQAQTVPQHGACGAIFVRTSPEGKLEIAQEPVLVNGTRPLTAKHLLTFAEKGEVETFIGLLGQCTPENPEVGTARFDLYYMKDVHIISFGHAEDKYTTKEITLNAADAPQLTAALRQAIR